MQESVIPKQQLYKLVLGGTGSVGSGTGRYLVVLGQKKAVLVDT